MDIIDYIADTKKIIDRALDKCLPSPKTKPQVIHKAMRYAVFPGGKRIRPILTIASFEACGGKGYSIMSVACAIELIHTYTLIHDDLPCMDNDDFRRGKLSCHKKFKESIALLAGDALLTFSFQLLGESGNAGVIKEISMAVGSQGTIGGQVVDILIKKPETRVQKPELDYIATHKTGALFEAAVKSAGIFKGVSDKKIQALGNFGRYLGWTFQLIDDLLDKDGSVNVHGAKYVREKAESLTAKAKKSLDIFGRKANRLLEIVDVIRCYK